MNRSSALFLAVAMGPWIAAGARAADAGLSIDRIMPAAPADAVRRAGWKKVRFSVDSRGNPWILHDEDRLLAPADQESFRLVVHADDILHAGNTSPLVSAEGYLGTIPILSMVRNDEDGSPILSFKPIRRLPGPDCRIHPGARGSIYAVCREPEQGAFEVYLLKPTTRHGPKRRFELILSMPETIKAATGDGETHFAALSRVIVRLGSDLKDAQPVWSHPQSDILQLAYAPETGLFYATASEAGRIEEQGARVLVKAGLPRIRVHDKALFVFSEQDWSILRVSGF